MFLITIPVLVTVLHTDSLLCVTLSLVYLCTVHCKFPLCDTLLSLLASLCTVHC